jgi:hypothetical protein
MIGATIERGNCGCIACLISPGPITTITFFTFNRLSFVSFLPGWSLAKTCQVNGVPSVVYACEQECERGAAPMKSERRTFQTADERKDEECQVRGSRKNDVKQPVLENGPVIGLSSNFAHGLEHVRSRLRHPRLRR